MLPSTRTTKGKTWRVHTMRSLPPGPYLPLLQNRGKTEWTFSFFQCWFMTFCKYYVCLIPTQFQESTGNSLLVFPYFWVGQSLLRLLTSRIALKGKKSIMIWRLRDLDNFSAYIVIRADSVFQLYIYVYIRIYVYVYTYSYICAYMCRYVRIYV